jgi:nucleoside phosphorylase
MTGFCGGVEGKSNFGDLLIFDSSYDWDYGKWSQKEESGAEPVFLSRPTPVSIDGSAAHRVSRQLIESDFSRDPKLLRRVELKSRNELDRFDIQICPAASGSAVVAHDNVIRYIRGLNDSIRAVDMESYGFYFACSHTQVIPPEFICMKAVADYCNGEKGDKYHAVCSEISCAAAVEVMTKWWSF